MRGTPDQACRSTVSEGIIPAYAGNTACIRAYCEMNGDHPRVCGEHSDTTADNSSMTGSSPRMRGTRGGAPLPPWLQGIIPAYAGNTRTHTVVKEGSRDHPRVCGEHVYMTNPDLLDPGSSPRMRGTRGVVSTCLLYVGIIPAYAGNTYPHSDHVTRPRDHPRVCGEHMNVASPSGNTLGSSPRMRGTPDSSNLSFFSVGIIPAYAGNTPRPTDRHW